MHGWARVWPRAPFKAACWIERMKSCDTITRQSHVLLAAHGGPHHTTTSHHTGSTAALLRHAACGTLGRAAVVKKGALRAGPLGSGRRGTGSHVVNRAVAGQMRVKELLEVHQVLPVATATVLTQRQPAVPSCGSAVAAAVAAAVPRVVSDVWWWRRYRCTPRALRPARTDCLGGCGGWRWRWRWCGCLHDNRRRRRCSG